MREGSGAGGAGGSRREEAALLQPLALEGELKETPIRPPAAAAQDPNEPQPPLPSPAPPAAPHRRPERGVAVGGPEPGEGAGYAACPSGEPGGGPRACRRSEGQPRQQRGVLAGRRGDNGSPGGAGRGRGGPVCRGRGWEQQPHGGGRGRGRRRCRFFSGPVAATPRERFCWGDSNIWTLPGMRSCRAAPGRTCRRFHTLGHYPPPETTAPFRARLAGHTDRGALGAGTATGSSSAARHGGACPGAWRQPWFSELPGPRPMPPGPAEHWGCSPSLSHCPQLFEHLTANVVSWCCPKTHRHRATSSSTAVL